MRVHEGVWDERICQYEVEHGHAEVLQWAKDNNCPGAENYSRFANRVFRFQFAQ